MKKVLLVFVTSLLLIGVTGQNKNEYGRDDRSETSGKTAVWANVNGNFVAQDIKGNKHDLQAYLSAGKTVIIDYSAVWCRPCWDLHQSGVFEQLYLNYGPNGTNEMVVLWIEIDGRTTLGNIQGDGGNRSQGDWTNGGTCPFPIINDAKDVPCLTPLAELYKGYYPAIFMVCPNGAYREISAEIQGANGADVVYSLLGSCPDETDLPVVYSLSGTTQNRVREKNEFKVSYFSVGSTTARWTFQGGEPATASGKAVSAVWNRVGTFEVKLEITNPAGTVERTQTIDIVDAQANVDDKVVDFESILIDGAFATDFFPYNWICVDVDKGGVHHDFAHYGVVNQSSFVVVDKRIVDDEALVAMIEPYEGNKCAMSMSNHTVHNNDWFISPKIELGDESSLSLYVKSGGGSSGGAEEYQIAVSTTNQDPTTFVVVGGKRSAPFEWTKVEVDLSAYNNRDVYVAVNNVGLNHATFLVDNIEVKTKTAASGTAVGKLASDRLSVYPNPAKNTVHVYCPDLSKIQLFDILGKEVLNVAANSENETVCVSDLSEGYYLMMVTTKENQFGTRKISVVK
ncbi:MAG: choice-of-anchor J domain-containing protein [Prevotellaceae bacterium]|jgi:hypothetical protein|nr:choice-of-anchor J domain-containing protein [Prevotellaceae bacterium]